MDVAQAAPDRLLFGSSGVNRLAVAGAFPGALGFGAATASARCGGDGVDPGPIVVEKRAAAGRSRDSSATWQTWASSPAAQASPGPQAVPDDQPGIEDVAKSLPANGLTGHQPARAETIRSTSEKGRPPAAHSRRGRQPPAVRPCPAGKRNDPRTRRQRVSGSPRLATCWRRGRDRRLASPPDGIAATPGSQPRAVFLPRGCWVGGGT